VPEHRPLDVTGAALALLLAALWGANPVAIKLGLADMPPLRLALMRFLLSTVVILAYAMLTGRYDVLAIRAGEAKPIWSLGILFVIQIALMNYGLERTTAAHGVIVLNSYAVHTVVFAHFLIPGDRLTPAKLAGVLIAYGGVIILFARSFSTSSSTLAGDLIVALSAVLLGERVVYIAKAVQRLDPVRQRRLLPDRPRHGVGPADPLDFGPGPLHRVPGRSHRRLQLPPEREASADLSAERAGHGGAHDAHLGRAGRRRHRA